jgi:hypothetical protein
MLVSALAKLIHRNGAAQIVVRGEQRLLVGASVGRFINESERIASLFHAHVLFPSHVEIHFGVRRKLAVAYRSHGLDVRDKITKIVRKTK